MFIMIEKVSFESGVPSLRKYDTSNLITRSNKKEALYNSQTYLLAALSGLAVIGMGCLFGKNRKNIKSIQNTADTVVNNAKKVLTEAVKDSKVDKPKPVVSTVLPNENKIAKPHTLKEGIDVKHLNAKDRNSVSALLQEHVTPKMQAEYNKEIAFKPLKGDEKKVAKRLRINNKRQNSEFNTMQANLPEAVVKRLQTLFPQNKKQTAMLIPINQGGRKFTA